MRPNIGTPRRPGYRRAMQPLDIRPFTSADAEPVAALIRAAFASQPVPLDPPPSALGETAASVAAHAGGGAVAELEGRIVGALLWSERDGGLYVGRLSVDPGQRRRGIARALLAAAETEARERGLPMLHLGTRLALAGNRALFAAAGFRETALYAHEGHAAPTWVAMEKRLG
jgi:ribosomal protein S18 acetylase RimI-like enzyme